MRGINITGNVPAFQAGKRSSSLLSRLPTMEREDYIYFKREFLNEDPSKTAAVSAVVPHIKRNIDSDFYVPGTVAGFPSFSVSDCTATISLDYSYFGEEEGREAVRKARKLAQICQEFAEALERQVQEGLEHERRSQAAA